MNAVLMPLAMVRVMSSKHSEVDRILCSSVNASFTSCAFAATSGSLWYENQLAMVWHASRAGQFSTAMCTMGVIPVWNTLRTQR